MNDLISREEAAKRLEALAEKWKGSFSGEAFEFAAKVVRGVPSATDNNVAYKMKATADNLSWIPVTERLPEYFGTFLVSIDEIHGEKRISVDAADFDPFEKKWSTFNYFCAGYKVSHWMPLPEPPKGE